MQMQNYARQDLPFFGKLVHLFDSNQEELIPLIHLPFSKENFKKQCLAKSEFSYKQRHTLVQAIKNQYDSADLQRPANLDLLLDDNCFTVCTGHQLNLLTGPLYTIYKIAHTIKLAEELSGYLSEYQILPIFWMASEDHDLEEINHFNLGDEKIQWNTNQTGAVGRMTLENWSEWQQELRLKFPHHQQKLEELFQNYQGKNLAQATRRLIQFLFADTPLIIVDGDDAQLKKSFAPTMIHEIETSFSKNASSKTSKILEEKNIKEQALAREINLFHLGKDSRTRIELAEDKIKIGTEYFSKLEIIKQIEDHPENFSPNVILRPLYQETILPNLCYIGGSGELAYWLQLKPVFEAANQVFPMLKLRVSAQITSTKELEKINRLGFDFSSFGKRIELVLDELLVKLSSRNLDVDTRNSALEQIRIHLHDQANQVDFTLTQTAGASFRKIEKIMESFEEKLKRQERKLHENKLNRAKELHQQFFPNGALQERHENFISAYLNSNAEFINRLLNQLRAFEDQFVVVEM